MVNFAHHYLVMERIIDIEKLLRNKMGNKARFVPGFLVSWLKKILHEDELNDFLSKNKDKVGLPWLEGALDYLNVTIDVRGAENFPSDADGKVYTFVSNHPLGGPDGLALGAVVGKQYNGKIKYLLRDELMFFPGLAPLSIPINKTGKQSRDFPAKVEAGFNSDDNILMFPAGICSRKQNGVIKDLDWNKTFVQKSVETHRDVVPIHFNGRNSDRFYNIANICKALHIKFNIAMLFLSDEMFKNKNKTFVVTIGKPIPWQTFDKSKKPVEWAQYVKEEVYKLSQQ